MSESNGVAKRSNEYLGEEIHHERRHGKLSRCDVCNAPDVWVKFRTCLLLDGVTAKKNWNCARCQYLWKMYYSIGLPRMKAVGLLRQQGNKCHICNAEPHKPGKKIMWLSPFPRNKDAKIFLCRRCAITTGTMQKQLAMSDEEMLGIIKMQRELHRKRKNERTDLQVRGCFEQALLPTDTSRQKCH